MAEATTPLSQETLSVTRLARYLKYLVEQDDFLTAISVHGEIAGLSRSASGHVYFTLKDATSQISCVLFRREALQQPDQVRELRAGMAVAVHGFLTVYEPRGTFQVYVERVLPRGEGALFQAFEKLKARLEEEGLFEPARKRALPPFPRSLALITSPGSQAYHDVLHRLRTQYPFVRVIEAGASVQGPGAGDEMVLALDIVNRLTDAEVILLVRGGGAPEELAAFNEERLARAIFASRVPVVTGIGHETDHTIADLVADVRAATPSLAATTAVPDLRALLQQMEALNRQSRQIVAQRLGQERSRWMALNRSLLQASPDNKLRVQRRRADELRRAGQRAIAAHLRSHRLRLSALEAQLDALDPLAILSRGYAVLTDRETGEVVSGVGQVRLGTRLHARVSDGEFGVIVEPGT